jgi:hypothetical protein
MAIDYEKVIERATDAWGGSKWRKHIELDLPVNRDERIRPGGHNFPVYPDDPPGFFETPLDGIAGWQWDLGRAAVLAEFAATLTDPRDAATRAQINERIDDYVAMADASRAG